VNEIKKFDNNFFKKSLFFICDQQIIPKKMNNFLKNKTGFYLIENLGSVVNLVHKS
jgi:hypothetical protein